MKWSLRPNNCGGITHSLNCSWSKYFGVNYQKIWNLKADNLSKWQKLSNLRQISIVLPVDIFFKHMNGEYLQDTFSYKCTGTKSTQNSNQQFTHYNLYRYGIVSKLICTPSLSLLLTLAPLSTRNFTVDSWPSRTAMCSGVH